MEFVEIHERFAARLQNRVLKMNGFIEKLSSRPEPDVADQLGREFHSLAGIGGTYGYPEITRLALEGTAICKRAAAESRVPSIHELRDLGKCVTAIAAVRITTRSAP